MDVDGYIRKLTKGKIGDPDGLFGKLLKKIVLMVLSCHMISNDIGNVINHTFNYSGLHSKIYEAYNLAKIYGESKSVNLTGDDNFIISLHHIQKIFEEYDYKNDYSVEFLIFVSHI